MLKQKVEGILDRAEYEHGEFSGCFDIIAKKQKTHEVRHPDMLLFKLLENVDSFQEEQASNLKTFSASLDASPALIGLWTRRERLYDNIIYERFDIPAFTPGTLESMLVRDIQPVMCRSRGGIFAEIDPDALRKAREEEGLSQAEVAEKLGISKKNVYEHESRKMKARYETARKMEKLLGSVIRAVDFTSFSFEAGKKSPRTSFEKKVSFELKRKGFSTNFAYQAPFNVIAKADNFTVFSDVQENARRIERNEEHMVAFAEITEKPVVVVTRKRLDLEVPVIPAGELSRMTKRDIVKTVKKW